MLCRIETWNRPSSSASEWCEATAGRVVARRDPGDEPEDADGEEDDPDEPGGLLDGGGAGAARGGAGSALRSGGHGGSPVTVRGSCHRAVPVVRSRKRSAAQVGSRVNPPARSGPAAAPRPGSARRPAAAAGPPEAAAGCARWSPPAGRRRRCRGGPPSRRTPPARARGRPWRPCRGDAQAGGAARGTDGSRRPAGRAPVVTRSTTCTWICSATGTAEVGSSRRPGSASGSGVLTGSACPQTGAG